MKFFQSIIKYFNVLALFWNLSWVENQQNPFSIPSWVLNWEKLVEDFTYFFSAIRSAPVLKKSFDANSSHDWQKYLKNARFLLHSWLYFAFWTYAVNKNYQQKFRSLQKWGWKGYIWTKPTKNGHILWQVLQKQSCESKV